MSHKNFHNLIESDNPEYKKAVYQKIESKLNLSAKKAEKKPNIWHNIAFRRTAIAAMAMLIVCLAIAIPLALKDKDKPDVRYCYMADCEKIELDCNAMEYASQNSSSILFVDWYDVAEEVITTLYVNKADNQDIVYIEEVIINGETGDIIKVSVCDVSTKVDILEAYANICVVEAMIKGNKVLWRYDMMLSKAFFEYNGYKYYLELSYPMIENAILEIVEAMLP